MTRSLLSGLVMLLAAGCGGRMPEDLGARDGRLIDCPSSPNCVSSFTSPDDAVHAIEPLRLVEGGPGGADAAWAALRAELVSRPRVEIVVEEEGYLHAVFTTRLMRYRDDVELLRRDADAEIAVRSASRVGYGDMNANRNRIESLRAALAERGVVRPASGG